MFGLFKKKKTAVDDLVVFCERADDALMLCYEQRDVQAVVPYFATPLLHTVHEDILSGIDLMQEYGIAKYRKRTWDNKQELSANRFSISKHIRHENVSIRGMIDIPVGDVIDEIWTLEQRDAGMVVCDIRRV